MEACQVSRHSGCSLFPSFPLWLYHHSTLPLAANSFITCCCHYHETFWVAPSANVMSEQNKLFDSLSPSLTCYPLPCSLLPSSFLHLCSSHANLGLLSVQFTQWQFEGEHTHHRLQVDQRVQQTLTQNAPEIRQSECSKAWKYDGHSKTGQCVHSVLYM